MNTKGTGASIRAISEPSSSEARRLRREANAVAVIKTITGDRWRKQAKREEPRQEVFREPQPGELIYFMYSGGLIKIGYTADIHRRVNDLTNMGGAPLVLIGVMSGTIEFEKSLHRIFKTDRKHGEWFQISDEIRRFLSCIDAVAGVTMTSSVGSCLARLVEAEKLA